MRWRGEVSVVLVGSLAVACASQDAGAVGGVDGGARDDGAVAAVPAEAGEDAADQADGSTRGAAGGGDAGAPSSGDDGGGDTSAAGDSATPGPIDAGTGAFDAIAPFDAGGAIGHVVFLMPGGQWSRIAAAPGAPVQNVEAALSSVSPGSDGFAALAPDGASLALVTQRFQCVSTDCLAEARGDLASAALVGAVRAEGRPAVAPGGDAIVYPASGGPHAIDLWAVRRSGAGAAWGAPILLSASSPAPYQHDPAIAYDGSRVVFDCGPTQYQAPGTSICEATLDGGAFRVVVRPTDGPGGSMQNELHHPGYAPDGSIVFEADWQSETIWRITAAGAITRISPLDVNDDNSPCVLPDGRIVSLWLGRAGNTGNLHEMKVMNADGSGGAMLVTNVDLVDVGETCGL